MTFLDRTGPGTASASLRTGPFSNASLVGWSERTTSVGPVGWNTAYDGPISCIYKNVMVYPGSYAYVPNRVLLRPVWEAGAGWRPVELSGLGNSACSGRTRCTCLHRHGAKFLLCSPVPNHSPRVGFSRTCSASTESLSSTTVTPIGTNLQTGSSHLRMMSSLVRVLFEAGGINVHGGNEAARGMRRQSGKSSWAIAVARVSRHT